MPVHVFCLFFNFFLLLLFLVNLFKLNVVAKPVVFAWGLTLMDLTHTVDCYDSLCVKTLNDAIHCLEHDS